MENNTTSTRTAQGRTDEDINQYLSYDPERKAAFFATTAYEKNLAEDRIDALTKSLKESMNSLNMAETSPLTWNRTIKPYFADLGITNGACNAIGKFLTNFREYIVNKEGESYFLNDSKLEHLKNHLIYKVERSKCPFFVEFRGDMTRWDQLEARIGEFSKAMFFREKQITLMNLAKVDNQITSAGPVEPEAEPDIPETVVRIYG